MDWKLEVLIVPVSDVDRAKQLYGNQLGFAVDTDFRPNEDFRVVQVTPPRLGHLDRLRAGASAGPARAAEGQPVRRGAHPAGDGPSGGRRDRVHRPRALRG